MLLKSPRIDVERASVGNEATWTRLAGRLRAWAGYAERYHHWLALAVCVAIVAVVYGRALAFPFFYDDTFDLSRTESQSFLSLARGIEGYAYYRPIPFLLWKALHTLQSRYDPVLLHAISLAAHALAGWVLYLLVRRLTRSGWAIAPALLFLTFPYSYQVVPIVGSVFHSFVTLFILTTLLLYAVGREEGRRGYLGLSLVSGALALWSHEYGVLVLGYLVLLEGLLLVLRRVKRPSWWLMGHLALGFAFLVVWLSAVSVPSPVASTRAELTQKGLFFLQGMAFPMTAQLGWLQERFGHDLMQRTLLTGGLAIVVGLTFYALSGRLVLIGLLAIVWSFAALLPVWWRLNWPYVENAPRLLYAASAGAAVFWGMLLALRWPWRWLTITWRGLGIAVIAVVLVQSVRFTNVRMDMLHSGGQLVDGVAQAGATHDGGSVLFANVPSWFVQHQQDHYRGHLGVTIMPDYIGLDRVIYTHNGARVRVASLDFRADTGGWRYGWQPHGPQSTATQVDEAIRSADEVFVADMAAERVSIRPVGRLERGEDTETAPLATFDGRVDLATASVEGTSGRLALALRWRVRQPFSAPQLLVVQLRDGAGTAVGEWRGYAMNNLWAPGLWRAGDRIEDRTLLRLPAPAKPGPYSVWLGFASEEDGRLGNVTAQDTDDGLARIGYVPE